MAELLEPSVARQRQLLGFPLVDADISATANINATKIGTGVVSNTEFDRLNGITSALEEQGNKGAVSGYAGLNASQELLLANFPTGTGLQVLRRNTGNTALEFATLSIPSSLNDLSDVTITGPLADGDFLIFDTVGTAFKDIPITGDVLITKAGVVTIQANTVDDGKIVAHTSTKITITAKGQLNSAIVYNDQANVFGSALKQTFTHAAASTGFRLLPVAGDVTTTPEDGSIWYNLTTNKFRARENGATVDMIGGGASLPVVDTTSIAEGSVDATKEVRFEVDGNTTGIIGVIATIFTTAKTITLPDATDTLMGKATTDVMTNKSYALGGTGNVLTGTIAQFNTALTDGTFAVQADNLSVFAATTSAQLLGVISDETGSGALVFGTSPTIVTPTIASFVNATHDHSNAAGGGNLTNTALTTGVFAAITGLGVQTQALDVGGFNIDNIQNLIHDLSTSGTDIDFTEDELQEISIDANTTFTGVNYAIGKSKVVKITTDATLRTLTFPAGWVFVGSKPADQAASKTGILTLTSFTAAEAGVVAAYAVEE